MKLQISQMGAEFECPRCKGNFLVNEDLTRASVNSAMQSTVPAEKRFEHSPHFNLQGSSAARMEESVSSSIF
ncbi:MAG: hypothetical protein R3C11_04510 [Planctomycetaceae bacterium]